jgi:general secretion pathway protein J
MTLLEVLVSVAILAMIAVLIYGVFDSMSRGKKGEEMRSERAHQGREAVLRIIRELQTAYLSLHTPVNTSLVTRTTVFVGERGAAFDRVDFAAFSHRRYERDAHESDQCELGFFVARDPEVTDREKFDLVRREQTPIDLDPKKGGVVNALAEDVESFHLRYLDPTTGMWVDQWDSTQVSGQPARLPFEVEVTLVLKGVPGGESYSFTTKTQIPIQQPLSFGIPQQ